MSEATAGVKHLTMDELEAGLAQIRQSPKDEGILDLIVARPQVGQRQVLAEATLDEAEGRVGDNWKTRGRSPAMDAQLTLMNSRAAALVAQQPERWPLAGDQLYVDFDLSDENLQPGSRLALGSAVVEVSALPHTGCKQFVARFGLDAMLFVNSEVGKALHLRGINTKIVQSGSIRAGDTVRKI